MAMPAYSQKSAAQPGRIYEVRGVKIYVETFGDGAPFVFARGGLLLFDNNFGKELFVPPQTGHGMIADRPKLENLAIREFLVHPERGESAR